MKNFLQNVKRKYQIKSDLDFALIVTAFSLAGLNVSFTRPRIFQWLGISHSAWWVKTLAFLLLFFPLYQLSTLLYGSLLGQFSFFWERQKKLGRFLRRKLLRVGN